MRKIALFLLATTFSLATMAQNAADVMAATTKTVKNEGGKQVGAWTKGGIFSVNVNQGGYDNWIPSGTANSSIGINGFVNVFANKAWSGKKLGKAKAFTNNLDIFEGIQKTSFEANANNTGAYKVSNKLDDRVDFLSRYSVQLKDKLSFATVLNLRTQLYDTKTNGKRTSGFFAPAYVTLAPGVLWEACKGFSVMFSPIANRWVIVSNGPYSISQNTGNAKPFGVLPRRGVDWQVGGLVSLNFNRALDNAGKINLKSRADFYSNYARNPQNVDIFFDNFLSMKVNKWISAGINLTMIYDDDIKSFGYNNNKAGLQYNHTIGVGLTRKF